MRRIDFSKALEHLLPARKASAAVLAASCAALVATAPALISGTPARAQSKELLLYNWSNYMSPDLLKRFESETGIKVTLDTYDSNETMLAKLQAGGAGYDLVVPTGPTVETMIKGGLLMKIDATKLANFKNVRTPFDKPDFDPERAGLQDARELHRLTFQGNRKLRERIERYRIDCGPVQDGALRCNMAGQKQTLEEFCEFMATNFDTHYTHWPRARLRETLATERYGDAFFNPKTYAVQPLDLTRGLARACAAQGGQIFERTRALSLLTNKNRKEVRTPRLLRSHGCGPGPRRERSNRRARRGLV